MNNTLNFATAVNGLVLSGGQSTRMGTDKGELNYHNNTQRKYLYDLLSRYCKNTFISCNKTQSSYIKNLPVIVDIYNDIGPMNGILSAFQTNPNIAWLVVACDLPFINDETIQHIVQHRNSLKQATVFWNTASNSPEPMIAVWEPSAYKPLLELLQQNITSPRKALINLNIEILHITNSLLLKNVNTKDEYKTVLSILNS